MYQLGMAERSEVLYMDVCQNKELQGFIQVTSLEKVQ